MAWIISVDAAPVAVAERDSSSIASRMATANVYEQRAFWRLYKTFAWIFPGRPNAFSKSVRSGQRAILQDALEEHATYEIAHHYIGPLENLFEALLPYCRSLPARAPTNAGGQLERVSL